MRSTRSSAMRKATPRGRSRPSRRSLPPPSTIPENLAEAFATLTDPLKLDVSYTDTGAGAAKKLDVEQSTFAAMAARFDGQIGAFAYLLMVLLYMPCVAAAGTIYQEVGWRWMVFAACWTTGLGWCAAVTFYQIMRFDRAPASATLWIALSLGALVAAASAMHTVGRAAAGKRTSKRGAAIGPKLGEIPS